MNENFKTLEQLQAEGWKTIDDACVEQLVSERTLRRHFAQGIFDRMYLPNGRVLYRLNSFKSEPLTSIPEKVNEQISETKMTKSNKGQKFTPSEKQENKKYWYDSERNLYVFFLKNKSEPFPVHGDVIQSMLIDYSSHAGKPSTIEEMARKHGLSRTTILEIIKALGKTHSSTPYSDEILESTSEDELVEDFLRIKEEQIIQRAEKKEWDSIKKDACKWREFSTNQLDDLFDQIKENASKYKVPKINFNVKNNKLRKFAAVMTPTDFHYGKYGWRDESGTDYSREIAEAVLIEKTTEAIRLVTEFGVPEKFIVGAGSDWFHIDTWNGTTTAGTPQDTDGNFSQIFSEGCDLAVKYIDMLRQVAPVEIILMAGNHDRQSSLSILNYLYAWYRNCPDVIVRRSPAPRQYLVYGKSLLGFTHGDKPKLKDLPALMSIEAKKEWGNSENRMWFTGDKHHEMTLDFGGVQIYQMPCLSGEDRWHVQSGYTMSRKALSAYLIDIENGMFASVFASI